MPHAPCPLSILPGAIAFSLRWGNIYIVCPPVDRQASREALYLNTLGPTKGKKQKRVRRLLVLLFTAIRYPSLLKDWISI